MNKKITTRELVELSIMAAVIFALKVVFSFIPNVHPVALLLISLGIVYGYKAIYASLIYVFLEYMAYGFSIWTLPYLYIWPLVVVVAVLLRNKESRILWTIVAALSGFLFGTLSAIPFFITDGIQGGISYITAGISFDLIHGISNGIITFFLIKPVCKLLRTLHDR